MSTQRMIKDSFWTDSYVANLDPIEKMLFLYLLTNPLCNIAGLYEIQMRRISFDTGIDKDMVDKIFTRFEKDGKLLRIDDWILIVNHAKHQSYRNPNVSKGIQRILEELPQKVKALKGFERLSHLTLLNLTLLNDKSKSDSEESTLKDNSNDMGFGNRVDDYDEGTVDLDGDGKIQTQKKTSSKKYPNAPAVRKLFQEILGRNPASWKQHTTQLLSSENLYTERGLESVRKALLFYKENEGREYLPIINTPHDLDSKWLKLGDFKIKNS